MSDTMKDRESILYQRAAYYNGARDAIVRDGRDLDELERRALMLKAEDEYPFPKQTDTTRLEWLLSKSPMVVVFVTDDLPQPRTLDISSRDEVDEAMSGDLSRWT